MGYDGEIKDIFGFFFGVGGRDFYTNTLLVLVSTLHFTELGIKS